MAWSDSQILDAIAHYYGTNSSLWDKIKTGGATFDEIQSAYNSIPQVQTVRSISGNTLGLDVGTRFAEPPSVITDIVVDANSNYGGSSYGDTGFLTGNVPANVGGGGGSDYTFSSGAISGSGSTVSKFAVVADKLTLATVGVSAGAKLGMKIDEALYNLNPEWWDENFPSINPQTWPDIAGTNELGQSFLRTLFGIKDGDLVSYVTDDVIAYVYQLLRDTGALNTDPYSTVDYSDVPKTGMNYPDFNYQIKLYDSIQYVTQSGNYDYEYDIHFTTGTGYFILPQNITDNIVPISDAPFTYTVRYRRKTHTSSTWGDWNESTRSSITGISAGQTLYYDYFGRTIRNIDALFDKTTVPEGSGSRDPYVDVAYLTFNGDVEQGGGIDGIEPMPNAPYGTPDPSIITGNDIPTIKQQLKDNYPELFTDRIINSVPQSDGSIRDYEYYPIPWPSGQTQTDTQPTTGTATQTDVLIDEETIPQLFPETQTPTEGPPAPPDTGDGSTPVSPLPTGSASSLWAVYNPTQGEVNAFGAWLWNSNFVEQLKKLFSDPMQAIIGIHKVFATPSTGGSQSIKCGYLDSGVSSKVVTNQYTSIDCGTVNLREYFGNVFDYEPYTKVSIFLPFIGIVPLDVEYILRSSISVDYKVDVITGACLANITVNRDGFSSVIFTYSGSAIVSYPISSGSYVGVISGAMSILAGVAGTIASGGSALPATMGALSGLGRMKTNVQHSGQFSGSAGAMGIKIPYLIISRPQTRMANEISKFSGYPSNNHTIIGNCDGFTQVESVHLEIPNAYSSELDEIEQLLKTGIII